VLSASDSTCESRTGRDGQVQAAGVIPDLAGQRIRDWAIWLTPMVQDVVVINSKMHNVPNALGNDWPLRSPGNARTEQFFFTK
jgi:hypothetical protein